MARMAGRRVALVAAALAAVVSVCDAGGLTIPTTLTVGGMPYFGALNYGQTAQFVIPGGGCTEGWLGVTMWDMSRMNAVLDDHADPLLIWRQGATPQVNVSSEPRITLLSGTNGDIEGTQERRAHLGLPCAQSHSRMLWNSPYGPPAEPSAPSSTRWMAPFVARGTPSHRDPCCRFHYAGYELQRPYMELRQDMRSCLFRCLDANCTASGAAPPSANGSTTTSRISTFDPACVDVRPPVLRSTHHPLERNCTSAGSPSGVLLPCAHGHACSTRFSRLLPFACFPRLPLDVQRFSRVVRRPSEHGDVRRHSKCRALYDPDAELSGAEFLSRAER